MESTSAEEDAFWETLQTDLQQHQQPTVPPSSPLPPPPPSVPPRIPTPSWEDIQEAMNECTSDIFREINQQTENHQQEQFRQQQEQRSAMPYPQCLNPLPSRVRMLHCPPPPLPPAAELPGGCASRDSPVSGDAFLVRPEGIPPFEARQCNQVKRVIYRLSDKDCMSMSREYHGTIYMNKELFYEADRNYADQGPRVARDLRRQSHYDSSDPEWTRGGQFLHAHVDMNGIIPGFEGLGVHKILVYIPDDGVDRYGPVFSLDGLLKILGYRVGGSATICLSSMFNADYLPLEIRLRTVTLTTNQLRTQRFRERFLDIHALKDFLVAFGYKQQISGARTGNGGNSNGVGMSIRLQLCSEFVSARVALRILDSVWTDIC